MLMDRAQVEGALYNRIEVHQLSHLEPRTEIAWEVEVRAMF